MKKVISQLVGKYNNLREVYIFEGRLYTDRDLNSKTFVKFTLEKVFEILLDLSQ